MQWSFITSAFRHKNLTIRKTKKGQTLRIKSQNLPLKSLCFSSSPLQPLFFEVGIQKNHISFLTRKSPRNRWLLGFSALHLFWQDNMCKDYKKDIFAVFAYDFEPSHNFQVLEKSMFYASFPTIAPGLGGSDFTALLRAFGDREIWTLTEPYLLFLSLKRHFILSFLF